MLSGYVYLGLMFLWPVLILACTLWMVYVMVYEGARRTGTLPELRAGVGNYLKRIVLWFAAFLLALAGNVIFLAPITNRYIREHGLDAQSEFLALAAPLALCLIFIGTSWRMAWLSFQPYRRLMFDRYPELRPRSLADYFRNRRDLWERYPELRPPTFAEYFRIRKQ